MDQYRLAAAQLVELTAFLGWLQNMDVFSLECKDITIICPSDGPANNFTPGASIILFRLLPSTKIPKTNRSTWWWRIPQPVVQLGL